MDSVKALELVIFDGIHEEPTRQYAEDVHAFDTSRGTRCGIDESSPDGKGDMPGEGIEIFGNVEYKFDHSKKERIVVIT